VVLASSFTFPQYAAAVLGAELIAFVLRAADKPRSWEWMALLERVAVAAATFGAYSGVTRVVDHQEKIAAVLVSLGAAALAQVLVDTAWRAMFRAGTSLSPRARLAWLAIASSGMLMAIGYRGVDGHGRVGI